MAGNQPIKNPGSQYFSAENNSTAQELINAVLFSSQSLDSGSFIQLSKAGCNYSSEGDYYLTTGSSSNTYNATPVAPFPGIATSGSSYIDGMRFRVNISVNNTGASTLNVNGFGAVSIVKGISNQVLEGGELIAGKTMEVVYVGASAHFYLVHNGLIEYNPGDSGAIAFSVTLGTPQVFIKDIVALIEYDTAFYNLGNNFNLGTHKFTAPVDGIYSFSCTTQFIAKNTGGGVASIIGFGSGHEIKVNASTVFAQDSRNSLESPSIPVASFDRASASSGSNNLLLDKGDVVDVFAEAIGVVSGTVEFEVTNFENRVYFSGYLLQQL